MLQREGLNENPSFYRFHLTLFDTTTNTCVGDTYESPLHKTTIEETDIYRSPMQDLLYFIVNSADTLELIAELVLVSLLFTS